LKAAQISKETI